MPALGRSGPDPKTPLADRGRWAGDLKYYFVPSAQRVGRTKEFARQQPIQGGEHVTADIRDVVAAQRRRRRVIFWIGFLTIAVVGSLWAGLSKDPLGPDIFIVGAAAPWSFS